MDRGVKKVHNFPVIKGVVFVLRKTYSDKLNEILSASQFEARNGVSDDQTNHKNLETDK